MSADPGPEPLFSLGGEMGALMAGTDWASTPLGLPGGWPQSLRTVAATCLECRFPMLVMWGRRLVMIYNEAFRPILGEKHPRSMGQDGAACWAEVWEQIGPMLNHVLDTGEPIGFENLLVPLERQGQQEDCYFTFSYSPLRDESGDVAGVLVTVFETTERVVGEERTRCLRELAEARADADSATELFRRAADVLSAFSSEVPFACLYRVGESGSVMESAFAGVHEPVPASAWPMKQVIAGRDELWLEELPADVRDRLRAGETAGAVAIPVPGPSGVEAVVAFGLSPRRPFDSGYRAFLNLIVEDLAAGLISAGAREHEHQRAEALATLDQAKTAFLANVSHEFRTPLTLMLGPLEDAIERARGIPELAESLTGVHRNGKRLLRLVNSLLDFTGVEAGQAKADLQLVDIGRLTAQIASSFAEVCERAGIELRLDCDSVTGMVDPSMWETVVLNLISNAFKFTLAGAITVSVEAADQDWISVSVADTGAGIAQDDLPRLSDRFFRTASAHRRSVEGSGIGLALVHSLVELHKGRLEIMSELGTGTTVRVRLPARPSADGDTSSDGAVSSSGHDGDLYVAEALQWLGEDEEDARAWEAGESGRPLLLVADDNADMRRYLEGLLRPRWDVISVGDGETALELARSRKPDLLITDAMMPTLDGFELVEAIRSDPDLSALPVIMLSARAGVDSAGEGFAAGSDDYLVKPFSPRDLVNRVAARLRAVARSRAGADRQTRAAERSTALGELATRLGGVPSAAALVAELRTTPVASPEPAIAALARLDPGHAVARVRYAGDLSAEFLDRYRVLALDAPVPIVEAVRTGRRMVISDTMELDGRFGEFVRDTAPAIRAALIEPLRDSRGEVIGSVTLGWPQPRSFEPEEIDLAGQAARLASLTLERIQISEQEHRIATALQERLLALEPRSTAAAIAALYQPPGEVLRVGGDWYTATALDRPGCIAISVGDVVGSGLSGATVMSQLRSALDAAALSSTEPGAVLDVLDRYASRVSGAPCATVAYAVIDTAAGSVQYACSGHPYPLVLDPAGTARYLRQGRRPPLASFAAQPGATAGSSDLPPGSLLLLYTDGLIERRGESLDAGLERLAAAAEECALLPVGEVCERLLTLMSPAEGYVDDVAMVALRAPGATPTSFIHVLPARMEELAPLRQRLREWLGSERLSHTPQLEHDVILAISEALNNAIEHGSDFNPRRTVSLEMFRQGSSLFATVSDHGRWRSGAGGSRTESLRGHGLPLMHRLSDDVKTVRTRLGTRVTMRFETAPRGAEP